MSIVCLLDTLNDLMLFSNIISPIAIIVILSVSTYNHDEPSELLSGPSSLLSWECLGR